MMQHTAQRGRIVYGIKHFALTTGVLVCLCMGIFAWQQEKGRSDVQMAYLTGAGLPETNAKAMEKKAGEEDQLTFTAWTVQKEKTLENRELYRTAKADVLLLHGSSGLLFPGQPLLSEGDTAGCLIDEKTAYELFGDSQVEGRSLQYGDRTLEIRGVLKGVSQVAVMQAPEDSAVVFDKMAFGGGGQALTRVQIESYLQVWGLAGMVYDYGAFEALAGGMALCLPFCLCLARILPFFTQAVRERRRPFVCLPKFLLFLALLLLLLRVFGIALEIPLEYIPTRWSDFSFFQSLIEEKRSLYAFWLSMEKAAPEQYYGSCLFTGVKWLFLSLLVLLSRFYLQKRRFLYIIEKKC